MAAPRDGCKHVLRLRGAQIDLRDSTKEGRDRLRWTWKGEATSSEEIGDPVTGADDYELCLFDGAGDLRFAGGAPAGGLCGRKPCWKSRGRDALRYNDAQGDPDGITRLDVSPGDDEKASLVARAGGNRLVMPALDSLAAPLLVELRNPRACWQSRFPAEGILRRGERRLQAIAIPPAQESR